MARLFANKPRKFFLLLGALFLTHCGVKLPPRATRLQEGPNDEFAVGKTGTKIPNLEKVPGEDAPKLDESKKPDEPTQKDSTK